MDTVEKTAKTVEEAIALALADLQCSEDQVEVTILSSPAKGFLGILGAKDAKVKVIRKAAAVTPGKTGADNSFTRELAKERPAATESSIAEDDKIAIFIKNVAALMSIEAQVAIEEDDEAFRYTLSGPRMGALIGRRGDTLDALQYLANIVAGKEREEHRKRIILDAEDYRKRREETLVRLANRLAAKAKRTGYKVVLEPMSPMERRVIHTALQNDKEVETLSEGEEPYRRLVIYPAKRESRYGNRYSRGDRYVRSGGESSGSSHREESRYQIDEENDAEVGREE